MAEEQTFDAGPVLQKLRDHIGMQVQSSVMLQIDYENLLKENSELRDENERLLDAIEKQKKVIESYEKKEKVKNTAKK